jgi:hypothetical protein
MSVHGSDTLNLVVTFWKSPLDYLVVSMNSGPSVVFPFRYAFGGWAIGSSAFHGSPRQTDFLGWLAIHSSNSTWPRPLELEDWWW